MKQICVFCSSSSRVSSDYLNAAVEFGQYLAEAGLGLVYGGASVGMMGALADAVLNASGQVVGVIPKEIHERVGHESLSELHVVPSMHERKAKMYALADAFVALPGGLGTMEELFEILTWQQLGFHQKPCGVLNVNGFFDELLRWIERTVREGFLLPAHRDLLLRAESPTDLVAQLKSYEPKAVSKWSFSTDIKM